MSATIKTPTAVLTSQELSNASSLDKKTEIKLANLKEMMQGVVDQTKASLIPMAQVAR